MPNISKILRISRVIFLIFFSLLVSQAQAKGYAYCANEQLKKKNNDTLDVICDPEFGYLYLNYSPRQRKIWIESEDGKIHKIVRRLDKNANPEKVGADENMRFITRKPVTVGHKKYIGLVIAERSTRGDGTGECGAGSEEYFLAYRFARNSLSEVHRSLIYSCIQGITLDTGDGNNNDFSVTVTGNTVEFRWLSYPGSNLHTLGHYDFTTNKLEITNSPP